MSEKVCKVFVYGTLKEGRPLDRKIFADLRTKVQPATIKGSIFNLGSFPTIKLDGAGTVIGEVHTFPEKHFKEVLQIMDAIEGYNASEPDKGLYNRHVIEATITDGDDGTVEAYAYEYNGSVSEERRLADGVWEPGL